MQKEFTSLV